MNINVETETITTTTSVYHLDLSQKEVDTIKSALYADGWSDEKLDISYIERCKDLWYALHAGAT